MPATDANSPSRDDAPAPVTQDAPSSVDTDTDNDPHGSSWLGGPAPRPPEVRGAVIRGGAAADPFDAFETPEFGQNIDHFRVVRTLGSGGMGRVLLARDTRLGRLVAIKVLRTDRGDAKHMQGLINEARVMARLSHPNIATVYHVGLWGGMPYLALEYVDGVSLRQRMRELPPTPAEALRIALGVARAVLAAHAAHIIHCDLKPENIVLPASGQPRVLDFGIATVLKTVTGLHAQQGPQGQNGTPPYMAPEQWLGEPYTEAIDLFALGVILYEMLARHRPFDGPGADRRPLPMRVIDTATPPPPIHGIAPSIQAFCGRLLDRDPACRPSAVEAVAQIEALLARGSDPSADETPFRGLAAFEERHAAHFFGRERDIDELEERLRSATVVPVVGPSGAGKSSLVQAGLLPRLRESGPWTLVALRPGAHPLRALAARLLTLETGPSGQPGADAVDQLAREIAENPRRVNVLTHQLADQARSNLLLFVDQLEEVATLGADPREAAAFVEAVALAADEVDAVVRVVVTLRDDFLGRLAVSDAMRAAMTRVVVLRRLDEAGLADAARKPVERMGYAWDDPGTPLRMAEELRGEPAALPLLQFACAAVWQRRDVAKRLLRRSDYEAIGGVAGALAAHAEAVLDGLAPQELKVARRLLLRLVTPEGTRRVLERSAALEGLGPGAGAVQERLTSARLLVVRRTREGDEALLELAHESLVHTWPQLARWVEESNEESAVLAQVEAAARLWTLRGRRTSELWDLDAATDALRRLERAGDRLDRDGAAFLQACRSHGMNTRKKKRLALGAVMAALVGVTVASLLVASELADREQLARQQAEHISLADADIGAMQLRIQFVDWEPETERYLPAPLPPSVRWQLREVGEGDALGPVRDPRLIRNVRAQQRADHLSIALETRAGPALLEVTGRGADASDHCGPSLLPARKLPGYAARTGSPNAFDLWVPTCRASRADTAQIPAGPFWFGGPGDPPIAGHLIPRQLRQLDLPAFRIDRREVSNAQYQGFAKNSAWTGQAMPDYPPDDTVPGAARNNHPVSNLDFHAAATFCAWMGKRLPSTEQWTKAGRGGTHLDAAGRQPNPAPLRNLPWGQGEVVERANLGGEADGWLMSAPVHAHPLGASPYGVLGLTGNVAEWTVTPGHGARPDALRVIRGGDWQAPASDGLHGLDVQNERNPRYFSMALGIRCVEGGAAEGGVGGTGR